ncbi:crotonase/enoyl-CoA hydratase family protein [Cumulibacter manganitolerans]|uniref:crotonase/enoyl-CoA hydratase family protein n=1 Tax=Cumulibacter manganitolerans TaxID=1884992 RepID=UPI0012958FD1|nr:crotonase/enoyl-CoA hydratase family protein [Cumulibacter manganitolerans]
MNTNATTSSADDVVLQDIRGEVGIVTLNRPSQRNALNLALRTAMQHALEAMDADPRVLAVVLTGAGGNFCAGRDLKAARDGEPMYATRDDAQKSFNRSSIRKPVIAAIEGYALAGGLELALSCDLLIASREAKFGLPEAKRNLVAIGGGLIRLPRRMPYHVVMEMALLGDHVSADELYRFGVLNRLVDPGAAIENAVALGEQIAASGPSAVRATKQILRRNTEWTSEATAFDAQLAMAEPALNSPDSKEGIAAFIERRAPRWTDR